MTARDVESASADGDVKTKSKYLMDMVFSCKSDTASLPSIISTAKKRIETRHKDLNFNIAQRDSTFSP